MRSATNDDFSLVAFGEVSIHALLAECDRRNNSTNNITMGFNPRTPCGVRPGSMIVSVSPVGFQSTHSLRSATKTPSYFVYDDYVSIHALLAECDYTQPACPPRSGVSIHALLAECDILPTGEIAPLVKFQSTHSLRSATAPNLIHCYSTKQIILCANLPKKTVIARLLFLSIYLSIFYSQCITPIADLPGNSCELEVGAQAMFNSL